MCGLSPQQARQQHERREFNRRYRGACSDAPEKTRLIIRYDIRDGGTSHEVFHENPTKRVERCEGLGKRRRQGHHNCQAVHGMEPFIDLNRQSAHLLSNGADGEPCPVHRTLYAKKGTLKGRSSAP